MPTESAPEQTSGSIVTTPPASPDVMVLSESFADDDGDAWSDDVWDVDVPGEASAVGVDGVGVMEIDPRGTYEWVRAVASDSVHGDVKIRARLTAQGSSQGTVFIGVHGDAEWRDRTPYLPQTGVALEYGYADISLGEMVLIVFEGADERRIGPVIGPVLARGESAEVALEAKGGRVRAKIWRVGDDEPGDWQIETDTSTDSGVVQLSYRDAPGQSVAWDAVTIELAPTG